MANIVDGPKEIMEARMRRYSKKSACGMKKSAKKKKKRSEGGGRWHGGLFSVRGVVSGGLPSLGKRR